MSLFANEDFSKESIEGPTRKTLNECHVQVHVCVHENSCTQLWDFFELWDVLKINNKLAIQKNATLHDSDKPDKSPMLTYVL